MNGFLKVVAIGAVIGGLWSVYAADTSPPPDPAVVAQKQAMRAARPNDPCADKTNDRQRNAAMQLIQLEGYDCAFVDAMCPFAFSEGYHVYCNGMRYEFELSNHGGKWSLTAD